MAESEGRVYFTGLRGMSLPRLGHDPRRERDHLSSSPLEWVPELGCWCVYDAGTITAILKSRDFAAVDFVELHRAYEQKVGIDCSALIKALQQTPSSHEGQRHAQIRRDLARLLASHSSEVKQHAGGKVRELVTQLCAPGKRVDLIKEIVRPVCNGLLEGFSAANGKLKTTPEYAAVLSMLGYDSIVGSLGASLLHVLQNAAGQRLHDIVFPRELPVTGVPYIERFAAKDMVIADAPIRKGDCIRLYLDSGMSGDDVACRPYFGRGRHSCLGEELSTWLWRTLTREFSQLPFSCSIESATRRRPDWVFVYYRNIVVRFNADRA